MAAPPHPCMNPDSSVSSDRGLYRKHLTTFILTATLGFSAGNDDGPVAGDTKRAAKTGQPSSHISSTIRAFLPAYAPPPPVANTNEVSDTTGVIFLDPLTVTNERPQSGTAWEMLTAKGRADYLKKQYPGATVPGDPLTESIPNYGTLMHRDAVRLQNLKELNAIADISRLAGDAVAEKKIRKEIQRTLIRRSDWKTESMDKSYNNNRR